jgi:hypothetical protein
MSTVLVVAQPHSRRDAWTAALTQRGVEVLVAPTLLAGIAALDDADPGVMIYEPQEPVDHLVLGAISNARDLPPVVLMAPRTVPVATRVPALRRLAPDADVEAVLAAVDAALALGGAPTRLPFRLCPALIAQWTVRVSAARSAWPFDPAESFDGATHPDGFALAAEG